MVKFPVTVSFPSEKKIIYNHSNEIRKKSLEHTSSTAAVDQSNPVRTGSQVLRFSFTWVVVQSIVGANDEVHVGIGLF